MSDPIRAVTTLRQHVLATLQAGDDNALLLASPELAEQHRYPLPSDGRPLAVTGLSYWPTRIVTQNAQGQLVGDTELRDLAVVLGNDTGVRVVPVNEQVSRFDPSLLPGGIGLIATPGATTGGATGDRESQTLYVADGTAGLTACRVLGVGCRAQEGNDVRAQRCHPWLSGTDRVAEGDGIGARGVSTGTKTAAY